MNTIFKRMAAGGLALLLLLTCAVGCSEEPSGPSVTNPYEGTAAELGMLMDDIAALPVGTMGVSMTAITKAAALLNWCEVTTMTDAQIQEEIQIRFEMIDEESRLMLMDQVALVTDSCEKMRDETARRDCLEAVGDAPSNYSWSDKAFDTAAVIGGVVIVE